jgi:hypothetical protein
MGFPPHPRGWFSIVDYRLAEISGANIKYIAHGVNHNNMTFTGIADQLTQTRQLSTKNTNYTKKNKQMQDITDPPSRCYVYLLNIMILLVHFVYFVDQMLFLALTRLGKN